MLLINSTFASLANCFAAMTTRLKQVRFSAGLLALFFALPAGAQSAIPVYEFYHTTLDHYFRTADAGEATGIDNGAAGAGWVRTGDNFLAYSANSFPAGAAPVCRFYGSVNPGPNSHFYTSDKAECDGLKALQASTPATQKRWNYEGLAFAIVPGTGTTCPNGLKPVYRLYNNGHARGKDSNHRYTTLTTEYTRLQTSIWKGEGVVMCAAFEGGTLPVNPPPPTEGDTWIGTASFKDYQDTASAEITWTLASRENNIATYTATGTGTIAYLSISPSGTCSYPPTSGSLPSTFGIDHLVVDFNPTPPTYYGAALAGLWPVNHTCIFPNGTYTSIEMTGGSALFGGTKGPDGGRAAGTVTVPLNPDAPMTIEGSDTDGEGGVYIWKFTRGR